MSQLYTTNYTKRFRFLAIFCAFNLLFNTIIFPITSYAVTSGPSQPEISSFASIDTSNMVDLFSGDFSYNIPLLELPGPNGGYPFNLVYNSGVSPEQEASWVGLGWNLTPGSIQRQMRGIPDEFNGGEDVVTKTTDMKNDDTFGVTVDTEIELMGFKKPKKSILGDSTKLALSVPITVYYNTYKGLGYTLGVNPSLNLPSKGSLGLNPGINFSLDNKDGVSITPSLGLQMAGKNRNHVFNLGLSYNSRIGLTNLGLNYNNSATKKRTVKFNSNINLYNQGRVPSSDILMRTVNLSGSANFGLPTLSLFNHIKPQIFFNSQWSVKKPQQILAYGYMYSQNVTEKGMMDINREKENPIFKESVSLSIPEATYDVYSVAGHGLQGSFRPYRSDIGIYGNPKVVSITGGGEVGLDFGFNPATSESHVGVDVGVNMGATKSTKWTNGQNKVKGNNGYKHTSIGEDSTNVLHEPFYFKFTNDRTTVQENELAYIGDATNSNQTPNLKPVRIKLGNKSIENFGDDRNFKIRINTVPALPKLEAQNGQGTYTATDITSPYHPTKKREARNTLIQQFTNKEINHMRLGKINYLNQSGAATFYNRDAHPKNHTGAFVVTKPDGARYIYALPAYNKEHIEKQVTVEGSINECKNTVDFDGEDRNAHKVANTDMYLSKTEISPYAYAHLLTAIVGDDYVDTDEIEGPSDGDIGYWVKFTYKLQDSAYHWRTPFEGVNYSPGFLNTKFDDKGSYMFGTKEIYYVATAETKSHIVKFKTSERADGRGAVGEFQNKLSVGTSTPDANLGGTQLKLEQVELYVKSALAVNPSVAPLKTVKLGYAGASDELCQKIVNREKENTGDPSKTGGKLTLKKVEFLYQKSIRGSYNAYNFNYAENPDYKPLQVDRWGSYTSAYGTDVCKYQNFPYVDQDPENNANRTTDASAWLLSSIDLPSGATINVDYESDDYAYVQNKVAMQMTPIVAVGDMSGFTSGNNKLNKLNDAQNNHKVFFKLEQPIVKISGTPTQITNFERKEVNKYIDGTGQVYFKSKIKLQKKNGGFPTFITGYADIKTDGRGLITNDEGTHYTHGYLTVKAVEKGSKKYHPFSVAAWQHIKGKQPKLLLPNAPNFGNSQSGWKQLMRNVSTLSSILPELKRMFKGYYEYMSDKGWGREMELENSWIRLNSADRIKYGGGVRVKRIVLNDKWQNTGGASYYGQQYDYRMEQDGELISSGVAAYEPQVGGEENPLRYGEAYEQKLLLATDNQYFLEHPINEGLYPSAQVGYRKVTVKSLAAANLANEELGENLDDYFINAGFHATTGVTVHEFYTAKEFPVIVDRTTINRVPFGFWLPLLIGQITMTGLTASQGFSVETNDMHGKPKQVTHYRQKPDGSLIESPVSWTKYNYKKIDRGIINKGGEVAFGVDNRVEVLVKDDGTKEGIIKEKRLLGLEREFVVDMQQQTSWSGNVSVDINADIKGIFPIPGVAPFIGASFTNTRSVTTNKIVSRSGILESVEAYDGTATLKTENLLWDAQTAEVLLTSVNNSFDSLIYNYSIPARFHYEKTKAAYHNADFQTTVTKSSELMNQIDAHNYKIDLSGVQNESARKYIKEGDEITIEMKSDELAGQGAYFPVITTYATVTKKKKEGIEIFVRNIPLYLYPLVDRINIKVMRSGNRNLLGAKVGAITALVDPTDSTNRIKTECEKEFVFPSDCDADTTGLSDLSINWTATSDITIGNTPQEIEVIPAGGTQTYTYIWNIYDDTGAIVRTLQSYTRKIPISNDPSNPLSGDYTITCTITDTQDRTTTSITRPIIFN
ncbi:hypothetical protein WAF17_22350 (plasmid) [Bernardetia sp. ABR2-2B]|uniref:hypothetical protein n=1 Tax=Bernardetia sp. ABR2-2B TaxID=3127472 RepID=UPI0030D5E661